MLSFTIAVIFLLITPGPGVLSLAGVGSAFGYANGVRYLVGLFIGTNLVCLGVITGLAAVLLAEPSLRVALTLVSAGYLLWLAFRIAFAGAKLAFIDRPAPPGIRGGIILAMLMLLGSGPPENQTPTVLAQTASNLVRPAECFAAVEKLLMACCTMYICL